MLIFDPIFMKQLFLILMIIIIMFVERYIIMISEDHVTEDYSNDAVNTVLITGISYSLS